jgi:hypothetical protein
VIEEKMPEEVVADLQLLLDHILAGLDRQDMLNLPIRERIGIVILCSMLMRLLAPYYLTNATACRACHMAVHATALLGASTQLAPPVRSSLELLEQLDMWEGR